MVEVICEIGKSFVTTHEEESIPVLLERAKELVREAKKCGCEIVKFQVHHFLDECHSETKLTSPHFDQDRYEWVKRNTYPVGFWMQIKDYCRELGVEFMATPMSRGAAILLDVLGVSRWKIGSGDLLDFVMLDYIRQSGKPVILSTGMSTIDEIKKAYNYLREKTQDVSILHCVSQYPCPLENLNLSTITYLKKEFPEAKIGFSDHSLDVSTGANAVNKGAVIIEKHFTLDRNSFGPDHKCSLLPNEFAQMIKEIKDLPHMIVVLPKEAYGIETKFINEEEVKFRKVFRKGLFASRDMKANELWQPDDIISLRPKGEALASELYPDIINTLTVKSYKKYEAIK